VPAVVVLHQLAVRVDTGACVEGWSDDRVVAFSISERPVGELDPASAAMGKGVSVV
jgi:hypothetical protein